MQHTGITKNQFLFSVACFFMSPPLLLAILFKNAEHEAWLISLAGAGLGFGAACMIMALYRLNRGKELAGICQAALGKTAGRFLAALYLLFFFFRLCSDVSQVSGFLSTYVLPETPIPVIIAVLVTACTVSAHRKAGPLCGIAFWLFLLVAVYTVGSIFLLRDKINPENYLPLFSLESGRYAGSAAVTAAELFSGLTVFLVLFNEETGRDDLRRPVLTGYGLAALILVLAVFRDGAVFGPFSEFLTAPSLQSARMINIGEILSRVELLYVLLFVFAVFFKIALSVYAVSKLLAAITGCDGTESFVWPVGILLFGASVISFRSYAELTEWGEKYMAFYLWIFEGILPAVLLVSCAAKRGIRNLRLRAAGLLGIGSARALRDSKGPPAGESDGAGRPGDPEAPGGNRRDPAERAAAKRAAAERTAAEKKRRRQVAVAMTASILLSGGISISLLLGLRVPSPFAPLVWIAKSVYSFFGFS